MTAGREKGKRIGPVLNSQKEAGSGAWCYLARIGKRWTISDLADRSRVSVRTIKSIEAGDRNAGHRLSSRLRNALGLPR